jgi:phosphopantetheinyl transferase
MARAEALRGARPSQWTRERLYRDHMFHGPLFRGIESIEEWGENGLSATLVGLPAAGLFRDATPSFLTDPVLVDAAGQMVGYWAAEHLAKGFNVFPYRIESLQLYGPPLPEGRRAACRATMRMVGDSQIHADLEVADSAGRLLLAVNGWEDVRVDLPDRFYRMCISPNDVFVSTHRSLEPQTTLCSIELAALPSFTAHGGIWLRALAHAVLSPREREAWRELPGPERRRIEWLLGRCCAKDAVRLLARESGQQVLLPADVVIIPDENGQPQVVAGSVRPAISISHADGVAVAAATLQEGMAIGIDVQRLDPSRDGFEDVALCEQERALLPAGDAERRRELVLRFWCAKEAVGKALGYGLRGGPGSMIVQSFEAGDGSVSLRPAGALAEHFGGNRSFAVNTSRRDDLIIATCLQRVSKEFHELSR